MDMQYLGSVLLALHNTQGDRPRLTTEAAVNAYYERHASADSFIPRIASYVAVGFSIVTVGLWLQ